MSDAEPEYDEFVVQRVVAHCLANGPPTTWRDLPPDVIHVVSEADIREASRRVKATSRRVAEASARRAAHG